MWQCMRGLREHPVPLAAATLLPFVGKLCHLAHLPRETGTSPAQTSTHISRVDKESKSQMQPLQRSQSPVNRPLLGAWSAEVDGGVEYLGG